MSHQSRKKTTICSRPWSLKKSVFPLLLGCVAALLFVHVLHNYYFKWFQNINLTSASAQSVTVLLTTNLSTIAFPPTLFSRITPSLAPTLPPINKTHLRYRMNRPPSLPIETALPLLPSPNTTIYNLSLHTCYEWIPSCQAFLPKSLTITTPLLDKKRGLLPGESGGKHAKENVTIFSPDSPSVNWTYTATEGQDLLVLEILDYKRNGIFVDVGARYWHKGSNSFALEYYYGWEGICIEPDSHFYVGLAINRTCTVICNNAIDVLNNKRVQFNYQIGGGGYNHGNDNEHKYTVNLQTIFNDFATSRKMDYLSLDIEGYELAAIRAVNLSYYEFSVISVERPNHHFHNLMTQHGYWWLTHLPGNFGENMYIHESVPSFRRMMNKYRPMAKFSWRGNLATYLNEPVWNITSNGTTQ